MLLSLPIKMLLSLLLGAIIGLERESSHKGGEHEVAGGIRTYALISFLGALAGMFYIHEIQPLLTLVIFFIGFLTLAYYALGAYLTKHLGMTNELSIIITFVFGFLLVTDIFSLQWVVGLLVVILLVLSMKPHTERLMSGISSHEVKSFISYALIALVVLPILPNISVTLMHIPLLHSVLAGYGIDLGQFANVEIFNPRKIWFIVALVTGIDAFGYLLGRIIGSKKSTTVASIMGGFISSTSATQSLAQKSKRVGTVNTLVGAALLANMASFFQIFLLVAPLNNQLLVSLTPVLMLIVVTAGFLAFFFLRKNDNVVVKDGRNREKVAVSNKNIFSLQPAIKFACLLIAVKLLTKISLILFGQSGFVVSSVIASFAGLDAIIVNLAEIAGTSISIKTAVMTFILVNATNLLSKSVYTVLQGERSFAVKFTISVFVIIAISCVGFIVM